MLRLLLVVAVICLLLATAGGFAQDSASDPATTPAPAEPSLIQQVAESLMTGTGVFGVLNRIVFDYGPVIDGQRVNLAKLMLAILVIVLGFKVAGRVRALIRSRVREHNDFMLFLERLIGGIIIVVFIFLAMDLAGIPLKAFAFLGGAIAIAIGFGAQELLANFISGIILIFEKPIRIGDLIEFGGERGKVADIGPRCTRIRRPGNVDLLVPNKRLLEELVVNWTLTDAQVRSNIAVGVAYGSPTRKVEQLLLQAVRERSDIDPQPEPIVLFTSFGDNALEFRLSFTVTIHDFLTQLRIESELRHRIDELFTQAGIVIAFPQRDVHLDTLKPLEVRLLAREEQPSPR